MAGRRLRTGPPRVRPRGFFESPASAAASVKATGLPPRSAIPRAILHGTYQAESSATPCCFGGIQSPWLDAPAQTGLWPATYGSRVVVCPPLRPQQGGQYSCIARPQFKSTQQTRSALPCNILADPPRVDRRSRSTPHTPAESGNAFVNGGDGAENRSTESRPQ